MFARMAAALIGVRVPAAACHGPRAKRLITTLHSAGVLSFSAFKCSKSG